MSCWISRGNQQFWTLCRLPFCIKCLLGFFFFFITMKFISLQRKVDASMRFWRNTLSIHKAKPCTVLQKILWMHQVCSSPGWKFVNAIFLKLLFSYYFKQNCKIFSFPCNLNNAKYNWEEMFSFVWPCG